MVDWHYDTKRGQYYYHDASRNVYQYQDGSTLPGPLQPHQHASLAGLYSTPFVVGGHGRQLSNSSLEHDLSNLSLSPGSPASPQSPQTYGRSFSAFPGSSANEAQQSRHIRALDTVARSASSGGPVPSSPLDHKYKVRSANFFTFGKVLRILWSEPTNRASTDTVITPYGEYTYVKIRWFIVVRPTDEGYSTCLPIQTYGGQGVGKSSLRKSHHGMAYTGKKAPKLAELEKPRSGESGMLPSIEVKQRSRTEAMDTMSRINYNKVYTVEHNCKVYEFGDVHPSSMEQFRKNFLSVWVGDAAFSPSVSFAGTSFTVPLQEVDEDSDDDSDDETETTEATAAKLRLLQHAHAQKVAKGADNPLLMVKHNSYVGYYVDQLRRTNDETAADWLQTASYEEQTEYMRRAGADV